MAYTIEVDTEDHFCDTDACIGGIARVRIEGANEMNGDIGGWDGWHCYATLIDIRIGGLTLTAEQVATAFGAKFVVSFEERIANEQAEAA